MVFQIRENTTVGQNNFLNILLIFVCLFLIKIRNASGNIRVPFTSVSLWLAVFPIFQRLEYVFKENIVKKKEAFFLNELAPGNE